MTSPASSRTPDSRRLLQIRRRILRWYHAEHRDFPWRQTGDPWAVLVSEVMLQQTQASRVAERFGPFMDRFPTTAAMAAASDAEVLAAWSGLGYNRRAVALRRAAAAIERAGWPDGIAGLEQLPGIGPYTARALAALAFGEAVGAVDTNVRRWLVRRLGLGPTDGRARMQAAADALAAGATSSAEAAAWMHASMEFGAAVCRARQPRCDACPVAAGCPSRGQVVTLPVARQPAFAGSSRELRGRLLRALAAAPGHRLRRRTVIEMLGAGAHESLLAGLERDGLLHRDGDLICLGTASGGAVATIGP